MAGLFAFGASPHATSGRRLVFFGKRLTAPLGDGPFMILILPASPSGLPRTEADYTRLAHSDFGIIAFTMGAITEGESQTPTVTSTFDVSLRLRG